MDKSDSVPLFRHPTVVAAFIAGFFGVAAAFIALIPSDDSPHPPTQDPGTDPRSHRQGSQRIESMQTILGSTDVTVRQEQQASIYIDGISNNSFTSKRYGFKLSWPDSTDWEASDDNGQLVRAIDLEGSVEIPIAVAYRSRIEGYIPNVAVAVQRDDGTSIEDWIDGVAEGHAQEGATVLATSVDPATRGGIVYVSRRNTLTDQPSYHIQRFCLANGYGFEISAGNVSPSTEVAEEIHRQLSTIVNSFRIIQ